MGLIACGLWLAACGPAGPSDPDAAVDGSSDGAPEEAGADTGVPVPHVEVGVPAGDDGLGFAPLEPGDALLLQSFGQGGTHLTLGVRTRGFGNRAYVTLTLRNVETGAEAVSPAPVRPQLLWCHDSGDCDLVPVLAMAAGLVEPGEEREGLEVEVEATVRNDDGLEASGSQRGFLSTADL